MKALWRRRFTWSPARAAGGSPGTTTASGRGEAARVGWLGAAEEWPRMFHGACVCHVRTYRCHDMMTRRPVADGQRPSRRPRVMTW